MIKKLFIFIYFFINFSLFSYPIDLITLPVYVKKGFVIDECNLPEELTKERGYYKVDGHQSERRVQIQELPLEIPKRRFLEWNQEIQQDFTFLIYLNIAQEDLEKIISPGFYFAEIGETWAIYINSHLIDNKIKEKSVINQKDAVVPVPRDLLKIGINILCIHIKGDPLSKETGFYYGSPYYFDELTKILDAKKNYLLVFLITIYTSIGILNLLFFIKKTNDKYYLYFSLFSLAISFYIFIRSSLVFELFRIDNYYILFKLELISLFLIIPFFNLFLDSIFTTKNKWNKFLIRFCVYHGIVLTLPVILLPYNALYDVLLIWQLSAPLLLILILIIITFNFLEFLKEYKKRFSFIKGLFLTFVNTIPGNLLIGVFFIVLLALIDIYLNIKKIKSPGLSNYGMLLFLGGASLRVVYNLISLLNQVESLNKRLKSNIDQIKKAYQQIRLSEEKYRFLFNNTSDILITLNHEGNITNISDSFNLHLKLDKNEFINKHLLDIVFNDPNRSKVNEMFRSHILQAIEEGKNLKIQLPLISFGDIPFKYFDVFIEKIASTDEKQENEFLFRATPIQKNPLLKFLEKEYVKFVFNTDIYLIDNIIYKLTEELNEFIDEMELSMVRIGLREILINAIEHGNLGITHEQKTQYFKEGIYHNIIKQRLEDPFYSNKKIIVEYKFTLNEIIYKITDEGEGFDVDKYLKNDQIYLSESLHGRGIFITKNAFDVIQYNKKGNIVVLIKKIKLKAHE